MNVSGALALVRDETGTAPLWQAAHVLAAEVQEMHRTQDRVRRLHIARDDGLCRECLDDVPCGTIRIINGESKK